MHVVGYYVVFNDVPINVLNYCGEQAIVGDYIYGYGLGQTEKNCTWAHNGGSTAPGVNGEAPYLRHGRNVTIVTARRNVTGNAYISLWIFPLSSLRSAFTHNIAATYGGAIYIGNSVNNVFVMPGTMFTDNTATVSGGAIFLDSLSNKVYLYSTMFKDNNASLNGGAVAFQNLIPSVHFYDCSFASNSAQYGGAVYFGTGNGNDLSNTGLVLAIEFVNVMMRQNKAALDGGGMYANFLNSFSLVDSRMVDNIADRSGGAIFVSQNNGPIKIDSTVFTTNRASAAGGAIVMNTINTMSISNLTRFDLNSAGADGGAIFSNANNTITTFGITTFARNICKGRGGALAINTGSIATFNGTTTFDSNYAQSQGGAIAISSSSLVLGPSAIKFINNSALSGSAIYLTSSSTSSVFLYESYTGIVFQNNICRGGEEGGTVYFLKDPQSNTELFGPQLSHYNQRVVFVNNTAGVGKKVATQTTNLRSTSNDSTIVITDYNVFLHPSLVFNLIDAFGNINNTDFSTTVS